MLGAAGGIGQPLGLLMKVGLHQAAAASSPTLSTAHHALRMPDAWALSMSLELLSVPYCKSPHGHLVLCRSPLM